MFEDYIIKKLKLIKSEKYGSQFDAFTVANIPVQIKFYKKKFRYMVWRLF
jgi:hypothetical protein